MSLAHGNKVLEISRANDMHFVYAFFFVNGESIHIKVGQSVSPYKRLQEILHGSPFPVQEAIFCHIGSKSMAYAFESYVRHALNHRRTRGEWYLFTKQDAAEFRSTVAEAYRGCSGRELKWSKVNMDEFAVGREGGSQAVGLIGTQRRGRQPKKRNEKPWNGPG